MIRSFFDGGRHGSPPQRRTPILEAELVLRIPKAAVASIRLHGKQAYPNECCGILVGTADGDRKEVIEATKVANLRLEPEAADRLLPRQSAEYESERNRFLIDPREQIGVERKARERGWEVLGYYHSHPDHPARPSAYDRDHGWPWYSYVILSVAQGDPGEMTSWVLKEDRSAFDAEAWESF